MIPRAPARIALVSIALLTVTLAGAAQADRRAPMPPAPIALLPLEDHLSSKARAINARGEIAGFSFDGRSLATIWDRHGRPWPLAPLAGDSGSEAFAINDRGEVAATASCDHSAFADPHPPTRLAPPEGGLESFARGINHHGEVAGYSAARNPADSANGVLLQAVRWSPDGEPAVLPPLAGELEAIALAINDRGIVVGYSFSPGGRDTAVAWDRRGTPHALLPLPDRQGAVAHAINRKGTVVGDSVGVATPTLWRAPAEPTALPSLADAAEGHGFAINHRDASVGVSISQDLIHSAVLWRRGAPPVRLPALPGHDDSFARDINGRGDVVGFSIGEAGFTAVLWPAAQVATRSAGLPPSLARTAAARRLPARRPLRMR